MGADTHTQTHTNKQRQTLTVRLAERMVHLDVPDGMPGAEELHPLKPGGFVGTAKGLGLLVSPIDVVFKES